MCILASDWPESYLCHLNSCVTRGFSEPQCSHLQDGHRRSESSQGCREDELKRIHVRQAPGQHTPPAPAPDTENAGSASLPLTDEIRSNEDVHQALGRKLWLPSHRKRPPASHACLFPTHTTALRGSVTAVG